MKDLLQVSDLSRIDLDMLIEEATAAKRDPYRDRRLLRNETVALCSSTPSPRHDAAFATAVTRLGGIPIGLAFRGAEAEGEAFDDAVRAVSTASRAIIARTAAHADACELAARATVPVINGATDLHDPVQALVDLVTLRERFGALEGLRIAYVGDGTSAAASLVQAAAMSGVEIFVATPPGYEIDEEIVAWSEQEAGRRGGAVLTTHDPYLAVAGAHAVSTDGWMRSGTERDRAERGAALRPYEVDEILMGLADHNAVFMHCLPARRGEEVVAAIIDGPRSVVFEQAANRVPVTQAVLRALVEHELLGSARAMEMAAR